MRTCQRTSFDTPSTVFYTKKNVSARRFARGGTPPKQPYSTDLLYHESADIASCFVSFFSVLHYFFFSVSDSAFDNASWDITSPTFLFPTKCRVMIYTLPLIIRVTSWKGHNAYCLLRSNIEFFSIEIPPENVFLTGLLFTPFIHNIQEKTTIWSKEFSRNLQSSIFL